MSHFTYMLRCADDTLYTGYTTHLQKRVETHNAGKGAKYTRGRIPVELIYFEKYENEGDARKREYALKKMSRKDKLSLIKKVS